MYMQQSIFRSNLKNTPSPIRQVELQAQIIDNNLRKSYIFQLAQKSKYKSKDQKKTKRQFGRLFKLPSRDHKKKLFQPDDDQYSKPRRIKMMMINMGQSKKYSNCCNSQSARQPVVIYLNAVKQMTIKNSQDTQILYHFNFNTIEAKIDSTQLDTSSFILNISERIMLKFEENNNEYITKISEFKRMLEKAIAESLGKQYHMNDLKKVDNFQKKKYKSAIQFAQNCQTGDILLFQGQQFWGKVQRFLTSSEYDHVGMIYKDPIHGVLIFQSNSYSGICLSPWESVLKYKWYQFLDKIVWRKLSGVQRTDAFTEKIQDLIMKKLGKEYHISVDKLLSNKSYIYRPDSLPHSKDYSHLLEQQQNSSKSKQQKKNSKQVGFFCSQLIAATYKDLQYLTRDTKNQYFKPSCNYYPYHFSQKFNLHLLKGQLSDEYIIHFDESSIKEYYQFED